MLDQPVRGYTNIEAALALGAAELERGRNPRRSGLLITDGVVDRRRRPAAAGAPVPASRRAAHRGLQDEPGALPRAGRRRPRRRVPGARLPRPPGAPPRRHQPHPAVDCAPRAPRGRPPDPRSDPWPCSARPTSPSSTPPASIDRPRQGGQVQEGPGDRRGGARRRSRAIWTSIIERLQTKNIVQLDTSREALVLIGPAARDRLIFILKEGHLHRRQDAAYVLGMMKDPVAVEPLCIGHAQPRPAAAHDHRRGAGQDRRSRRRSTPCAARSATWTPRSSAAARKALKQMGALPGTQVSVVSAPASTQGEAGARVESPVR